MTARPRSDEQAKGLAPASAQKRFAGSLKSLPSRLGLTRPRLAARSLVWLTLRVGSLLILAVGLELMLMRLTRLRAESVHRSGLLGALVENSLSLWTITVPVIVLVGIALAKGIRTRSFGPAWTELDAGTGIRWLTVLVAGLLVWNYATSPFNLYFDQAFVIERLLLVGMFALLVWRAAFVLPFVLAVCLFVGQFNEPIGGFSWAAPVLLIRVLILVGTFWILRLFTDRVEKADLVFLICCLVLAHFWVSGLGKVRLGWMATDQVAFLLPATYANGWLAFLEPDTIAALTSAIASMNWPIKIATLLIECGALVALWRLALLRGILVAAIALHTAIFLVTGIAFWSWMVLEAGLLALFVGRGKPVPPIFTTEHFLLSVLLIGAGAIWFRPVQLAWLDSRVSYTYRLEAFSESGRTFQLPPRFFRPYDYQFTLGDFRYLTSTPHLRITWGSTRQRALAAALQQPPSPSHVFELETTMGSVPFNARRSATFDDFVHDFVASWNERGGDRGWWSRLQPPPLLWTFARGPVPEPGERITRVVVHQVTSLFDDRQYLEIRERPVRTIEISSATRQRAR